MLYLLNSENLYRPKPPDSSTVISWCVINRNWDSFYCATLCYSAVFAIAMCLSVRPSVCLSQAGIVSKRLDESSCFFWHGGFHPLISHCVIRKFRYLQNRLLPSVTLSQASYFINFATASRPRCQQNSSSSTVKLVADTYTTADKHESWPFTTSRSTVTL